MTKPTIVCVPGAWCSPTMYDKTMQILENDGYGYAPISLPSVGADPPLPNFDADVKAIRDSLTRLVEEEKDVVLALHSYSGFPGSEAPVGLGKKDREARGLQGGVIRIVYIMAFAMPEGFSPFTAMAGEYADWVDFHQDNGEPIENCIQTVSIENAERVFFNDSPPEEAKKWANRLSTMSSGPFSSTSTYAAWRHIPSTFIICEKDKTVFTPEGVRAILELNRKIEPNAFDVVEEVNADHCPMISRPEWLAGAFRRAAGEAA